MNLKLLTVVKILPYTTLCSRIREKFNEICVGKLSLAYVANANWYLDFQKSLACVAGGIRERASGGGAAILPRG